MEEKNEVDKLVEDVMLPGFRFHPTDEELVGFYLKRKIQNRPLYIELIKQVDIYKYDPWDLPKLGSTGEKEWYFYCPRDRKYRNSTRPNRVTGAGFWKATGTDRPIYSSHGNKCIGLKKSLVFYRGRAAKGIKTDWMMHEFRLPSSTGLESIQQQTKKLFDKTLPPNDSWAICRIFKKSNSMAQRTLSHSWVSGFPEITASDSDILIQAQGLGEQFTQFSSEIEPPIQFCNTSHLQQQNSTSSYDNKPSNFPFLNGEVPNNGFEVSRTTNYTIDATSMLFNTEFQSPEQQFGGFSTSMSQDIVSIEEDEAANLNKKNPGSSEEDTKQWEAIGFPFSLPSNIDAWKPTLPWDSPPCSSEMSTSFSTNRCFT